MAIWSLVLFVVAELAVGQVVEPLLYGRSTGLSPFSVVVAAIFWSWIWGPIGLILSTPLTLCLLVVGRHVRRLEFLDVLLGDQPALTPVENFYQRALAGDPDEAIEQAEVLLRDRSLSAYYDDVAIKGLRLAAKDVTRGSVTSAQLARIEATTNDLVDGLDGYEDREPAPLTTQANWGAMGPIAPPDETQATQEMSQPLDATKKTISPTAVTPGQTHTPEQPPILESSTTAPMVAWHAPTSRVLCLPGRGPLDALATTILLQLLGKQGFAARSLPHEAVSRASIDSLEADDVGIVCILYLQIDGIPPHLRYLIRRIRARLPKVSVVVGLWTPAESEHENADPQGSMGADCSVTSLQQMLAACRHIDATRTMIAEPQYEDV
jgi:hypothetical protein